MNAVTLRNNYYGVIGNSDRIWKFAHFARRLVFK